MSGLLCCVDIGIGFVYWVKFVIGFDIWCIVDICNRIDGYCWECLLIIDVIGLVMRGIEWYLMLQVLESVELM